MFLFRNRQMKILFVVNPKLLTLVTLAHIIKIQTHQLLVKFARKVKFLNLPPHLLIFIHTKKALQWDQLAMLTPQKKILKNLSLNKTKLQWTFIAPLKSLTTKLIKRFTLYVDFKYILLVCSSFVQCFMPQSINLH